MRALTPPVPQAPALPSAASVSPKPSVQWARRTAACASGPWTSPLCSWRQVGTRQHLTIAVTTGGTHPWATPGLDGSHRALRGCTLTLHHYCAQEWVAVGELHVPVHRKMGLWQQGNGFVSGGLGGRCSLGVASLPRFPAHPALGL